MQQLRKDAPDRPHVNGRPVLGGPQKQLRGSTQRNNNGGYTGSGTQTGTAGPPHERITRRAPDGGKACNGQTSKCGLCKLLK